MFSDLFILDLETKMLKQHEWPEGAVVPAVRNSHTLTKGTSESTSSKAYLFGGANTDGPLKDLYELDMETLVFKKMLLDESEMNMPMVEMHSAHMYKGTHLLIIGGRKLEQG